MVALFLFGGHVRIAFSSFEQALPLCIRKGVPLLHHRGKRFSLCGGEGTPGLRCGAVRYTGQAQQQKYSSQVILHLNSHKIFHPLRHFQELINQKLINQKLINENLDRQVVSQNRHIQLVNLLFLNVLPITCSDSEYSSKQSRSYPRLDRVRNQSI